MENTKEIIESVLEPEDVNFVYSNKAKMLYNFEPAIFEEAVEEYKENFYEWELHGSDMLFHIKASKLFKELEKFYNELSTVTDQGDGLKDFNPEEKKAYVFKTKQTFLKGVNTLAPFAALMYCATQTTNKA